METPPPTPQSKAERLGRRVSVGLYFGLITAFTLICSIEVIVQAWASPPLGLEADCRLQAKALAAGLQNARAAARHGNSENQSLELFRTNLGPNWDSENTAEHTCAGKPRLRVLIKELNQLRYAEEHAVRYEARELTQRRQRVSMLQRELGLDPAPH